MAAKKAARKKSEAVEIVEEPCLDTLVLDVNKQYGAGTLLRASDSKTLEIQYVPFGVFDLDLSLGGGIPLNRMTVITGEYSTGKSGLCLKAAASFQRHCRYCKTPISRNLSGNWKWVGCACTRNVPMRVVWMDIEHAFDMDWAKKWSVDVEALYVIQTEYAEQGIDVADKCIRSQMCDLLVVDSIAAMTPSIEIEQSSEKWQVGVMARLMNKALRKWTSALNSSGMLAETYCTILLINQIRLNLGGYGASTTEPGGKGIAFFKSVAIKLKRVKWVEHPATGRSIAADVEYVISKNKTAPAMRAGAFRLYFVSDPNAGYFVGDTDNDRQLLRLAIFWGEIKKGGSWITFPDGSKVQGEDNATAILRKDPELLAELVASVAAKELGWRKDGISDGAKRLKSGEDD